MSDAESVNARVERLELPFNSVGVDPYGISKDALRTWLSVFAQFYRHYFRVKAFGVEHIPARGRAMLVGNHSGGIAVDGAMVITSAFLEMEPPRLVQAMADKFLNRFPFASQWTLQTGQLTGLPEHAERLLRDDRLLLIFPEGARGTAKLYPERYSLVDFGTGFMRLALRTQSPIIPFAFLGGGSAIPTFTNLYTLGRLLGVPYLPVTPWLLPFPLPIRLEVHYGAPLYFEGTGNEESDVIDRYVGQVRNAIQELIAQGRERRRLARAEEQRAKEAP